MPEKKIISALISGFIWIAFEGISSFLQHKWEKALQQAMNTMNKRVNTGLYDYVWYIQCRYIREINTDGT